MRPGAPSGLQAHSSWPRSPAMAPSRDMALMLSERVPSRSEAGEDGRDREDSLCCMRRWASRCKAEQPAPPLCPAKPAGFSGRVSDSFMSPVQQSPGYPLEDASEGIPGGPAPTLLFTETSETLLSWRKGDNDAGVD